MFLIQEDFYTTISKKDLDILTSATTNVPSVEVLNEQIDFAVEFVKSKIQHRYDPSKIFYDLNEFDINTKYVVDNLIYYTEPAYDNTKTYLVDQRVSYNNYIYKCILDTQGNDPTNTDHWEQIKINGTPIYNYSIFNCIVASQSNYPDDTTYWSKTDTRPALIKKYVINVAIYELFSRVNPRNLPEWAIQKRDEADSHLNRIAKGTDTPLLPLYADEDEGQRIVYGGDDVQRTWDM